MARYRMLAGSGLLFGVRHKKGDIIETSADLMKMFPNSFERVRGAEEPTKPSPTAKPKESVPDPEPPEESPGQADVTGEAPPSGEKKDEDKGRNVTASFPKAVDEDFRVYKKAGKYFIYDADDLTKVLNASGIKKTEVNEFITTALEG